MNRAVHLFAVALLAALGGAALADTLAGRVVAVHDGDTLTLLVDRTQVRVRLAGIDAPEHGQPYASAARRALARQVAGRDVLVEASGRDGYGRTLGVVSVDGVDVNRAQVRDGMAWVFRRFSQDAALLACEEKARSQRRGLWREAQPEAPWHFRERNQRKPVVAS